MRKEMCIMFVLAGAPIGLSASQVVKRVGGFGCEMSKGQIVTAMENLVEEGYVIVENAPYRPNIGINIYHITSQAAEDFKAVSELFESKHHQLKLEGGIRNDG